MAWLLAGIALNDRTKTASPDRCFQLVPSQHLRYGPLLARFMRIFIRPLFGPEFGPPTTSIKFAWESRHILIYRCFPIQSTSQTPLPPAATTLFAEGLFAAFDQLIYKISDGFVLQLDELDRDAWAH